MKLRYFSHAACLLKTDSGARVLIDPFLDGNPTSPVGASEVAADYIILTHGHGDHLGDTLSIAKRCGALCICENELATYLDEQGLKTHHMHIGGAFSFDFGTVKLTQALHGSETPDHACHGTATGILMTADGKTVYHMGDTGLFSDMKLIGQTHPVDYLMVPIGDNFTMGIEDAVIACSFVQPGCAIPIHYNTFDVIQTDPDAFKAKLSERQINCQVLEFGQEITL